MLNAVSKVYLVSSIVFCTLGTVSTISYADTVKVPVGQQGYGKSVNKPVSGITKTQVKRQFGEPKSWRPTVGQPPISSWVYANFTVYFEYDRVIHAVVNR